MVDNRIFLSLCIFSIASSVAMAYTTFDVRNARHMRAHFRESMDVDRLSEQDMLFHYFRVHDVEGDSRLDGCELLQTLVHYHVDLSVNTGTPVKIFSDDELSKVVDSVLDRDDKNMDGFVDYREFLSGEISKGL